MLHSLRTNVLLGALSCFHDWERGASLSLKYLGVKGRGGWRGLMCPRHRICARSDVSLKVPIRGDLVETKLCTGELGRRSLFSRVRRLGREADLSAPYFIHINTYQSIR